MMLHPPPEGGTTLRAPKFAATLILALLVSAFAFSHAQEVSLAPVQVLKDASPDDDITGLDPMLVSTTSAQPMMRALYDGLVRYDFEEVAPHTMQPAIAESWSVSEDGTVWTFNLRKGVQFHKGYGEVTAHDVKFSVERHIETGGQHAADYSSVRSIDVIDEHTIEFTLEEPDSFFLYTVGNVDSGYIVSKAAVEELGPEAFNQAPIGTGAFQFKEWISKDKVVLERHEEYWRGTPTLERVEFIFMPDINTRSLALMQGEVHAMTSGLDSDDWITQMRAQGLQADVLAFDSPMLLHFNMKVEPLNDIRVRKALAHALNRQSFVDFHGELISKIQYSPLPPEMYAAIGPEDGLPDYEYDLERAKELLAEAGYPDGFDLGEVLSSVRSLYVDPLQIIQGEWAKIGVTFQIRTVAHGEYHAQIREQESPIVAYPGPRATPDMIFMQYLHSSAAIGSPTAVTNFSHYGTLDANGDGSIDGIDALVEAARASMDVDEQLELYRQAQIQVMRDLPVFPLRVIAGVQARAEYVDLGHPPYQGAYINGYAYTEGTQLLSQ